MAEKVIKSEDIAQSDLFKDMRDSAAQTLPVMKELSNILGSFMQQTKENVKANPLGSAQDINAMTSAYNSATSAATAKLKVDKEIAEQEAKLSTVLNEKTGKMNDNLVELAKLRLANEEARKQAKELAKEELGLNSEYSKQSKTLNDLRKQYKELALTNKGNTQEAKALLQQVTQLDKKLKDVDATVGQHQRNVGNYSDALRNLPAPLQGVADAVGKLTNIWGLAAAALGVVVSIFLKFEPVVEWFERKLAGLGAAWTVVSDAVVKFGAGMGELFKGNFTEGIKQMTTAFDGMGASMAVAFEEAEKLKGKLQELEDNQSLINLKAAIYSKEAAKLDKQSRDRTKTYKERIDLLKEALDFEEKAFKIQYDQDNAIYHNQLKIVANKHKLSTEAVLDAIFQEEAANKLKETYVGIGKELDDLRAMQVKLQQQEMASSNFQETRLNKVNKLYEQQAQLQQKLYEENQRRLEKEQADLDKQFELMVKEMERLQEIEDKAVEKAKAAKLKAAQDALTQAEKDAKDEEELHADLNRLMLENEEDALKEAEKKREEATKARIEREKAVFAQLEQIANQRFANEEKRLDRTIANSQRQQQTLALLAQQGVDNAAASLAQEQKIQADAEAKRAELLKKKEKTEFALTVLKMTTANLEANQDNPSKALIDTGVQVGALIALIQGLPSFFEGTEDTGNGGGLDGKGGFLSVLHPNERVMTAEQNAMIGDISNKEAAKVLSMYNAGLMPQVAYMPNYNSTVSNDIVKKLDSVEKAIKQIEIPIQSWAYDATEQAIIERVETRTKRITNHIKPKRGLWS